MNCVNCKHPETEHPNHFLCHVEECRCPGWRKPMLDTRGEK